MPYTNTPWTDNTPIDSSLADALGADIRQLRLDIRQRLETGLIVDLTADPVVLQPGVLGSVTGGKLIIPFCDFNNDQNAKTNSIQDAYVSVFVSSQSQFAQVKLPVGCVITQMDFNVYVKDAAHMTCALKKNVNAAGAQTITTPATTGAFADASGNFIIKSITAMNVTITSDFWFIEISNDGTGGSESRIAGVVVTFNRDLTAHAT